MLSVSYYWRRTQWTWLLNELSFSLSPLSSYLLVLHPISLTLSGPIKSKVAVSVKSQRADWTHSISLCGSWKASTAVQRTAVICPKKQLWQKNCWEEGARCVFSGSKPAMSLKERVTRKIGITVSPTDCTARYRNHKRERSNESQCMTDCPVVEMIFLSLSFTSMYRLTLDLMLSLCSGMEG